MTRSGENDGARSSNRGDDDMRKDESVIGPAIDPERLAALIDGRLGPHEREALLAQIAASSDEDVEIFSDALAATRELEGGVEGREEQSVAAARSRRAVRWRRPASLLAIAAAVVAVVVLPGRLRTRDSARDPGRFARVLAQTNRGLPANWDTQPWGATRGGSDALTPAARALRVGARMTELELAARARDPRTPALATSVVVLLEGIPGAAAAATEYRALASADSGSSPEQLTRLAERARVTAAPFADQDYLEFGAWLEAARLAAAGRHTAFFTSSATTDALARARELRDLSPSARAAVGSLSGVGTSRKAPDWDALGRTLTSLLGALAR
jgi:hypothetical protein